MESVTESTSNEALISAIMSEVDESCAYIRGIPGFTRGPDHHPEQSTSVKVIHIALTVLKNNKVQTFNIQATTRYGVIGGTGGIKVSTQKVLEAWINSNFTPGQSLLECSIDVELFMGSRSSTPYVTYPLCSYKV